MMVPEWVSMVGVEPNEAWLLSVVAMEFAQVSQNLAVDCSTTDPSVVLLLVVRAHKRPVPRLETVPCVFAEVYGGCEVPSLCKRPGGLMTER